MTRSKKWPSIILGLACGLALTALWLVLWHMAVDAAQYFAPALALLGLTAWYLSDLRAFRKSRVVQVGLETLVWASFLLAGAASLSLGAFLPGQWAEWVSPPLGRFGGGLALLLLAIGLGVEGIAGRSVKRRGLMLDAAAICGLGAFWTSSQTQRQAAFPPTPTTATLIAPRFDLLFWLSVVFVVFAVLFLWLGRVGARAMGAKALDTWALDAWALDAWALDAWALDARRGTAKSGVESAGSAFYAPWLVRWSALLALFGLAGSLITPGAQFSDWLRFALMELVIIPVWLVVAWLGVGDRGLTSNPQSPTPKPQPQSLILREVGWLVFAALAVVLIYFSTSEDLEIVMLRNTIERPVMQFWRGVVGDERFATKPTGALSGTVRNGDDTQTIEGAAVVVSDVSGAAYTAYSDKDGRYRIEGVPTGNYLPMAVAPTRRQAAAHRWGGRVAAVRPGQTTEEIDFRLEANPMLETNQIDGLKIASPTDATVDNPERRGGSLLPAQAIRREFSFKNGGMTLNGGLIHEPPAKLGPGPFPILLIIFPGEANKWEGVSIPLASKGYVVVSYFPVRLIDFKGDLDDLMLLLDSVGRGRLSQRGDKNKITLVGGSISTAYTYLMAREAEGNPIRQQIKATVQYGGLFDFFKYRHDWEQGKITIDPGISQLEYLLIALGRPDTRPELYLRLSPMYALGPDTLPPTLLVHTDKDIIVPVEQSHITDEKLNQLGTPHKLITYPNLEHYLDTSKRDPAQVDMLNQTVEFLDDYAK